MKSLIQKLRRAIGEWLLRIARTITPPVASSTRDRITRLKRFWFVADAPLFIDEAQVARLFDSIVRPEFEVTSRSRSASTTRSREIADELAASAEASLIPAFFKATASAKSTTKTASSGTDGTTQTEAPVRFADIKLEKLIALYESEYPERLLWVSTDLLHAIDMKGTTKDWSSIELLLKTPGLRPLVVLDLEEHTKLMPMAAELEDGTVVELSKTYIDQLKTEHSITIPSYPRRRDALANPQLKKDHWSALLGAFDSSALMRLVENSTKSQSGSAQRINWIDFRTGNMSGPDPEAMHLHITADCKFPTGTFAYQLIKRGETFGVRIVGTLKRGQDINVLAIYER